MIDWFVKKPTMSIPEACGSWKATKGAYRFFNNNAVSPAKILRAHYEQTEQRLAKETGIILVAQDTTDCDYSNHPKTKGLGYLQGEKLFGIKVHTALAMSEGGTPFGILAQKRWIRKKSEFRKWRLKGKRTIRQTENYRWISTYRQVAKRIPAGKYAVVVADREAAIYDVFAQPRKKNIGLLIRAKNRSVVSEQKKLYETMQTTQTAGVVRIKLQKTPARKQRMAIIGIHFARVTILSSDKKQQMQLWCVAAKEQHPPINEQGISWILLTTVPVNSFIDAKRIVFWYTKRWIIERFHYCLKSGCRIEELQLQEEKRLERALAVYTIVAWELLWITYEAREHPEETYTRILSEEEWQVLCQVSVGKRRQMEKSTIQEAVRMLAKLGGFLGRHGDKQPGIKTLWIGIRRFTDIMNGWNLSKQKDVGKG